jgi:hypothetical protein
MQKLLPPDLGATAAQKNSEYFTFCSAAIERSRYLNRQALD